MQIPAWERVLWSGRPVFGAGARYLLTDFRLVRQHGGKVDELMLGDIAEVQRTQSALERVIGASTIAVHPRIAARPPLVLRSVRRGAQLAALLELLAGDPQARMDAEAAAAALAWEPRLARSTAREGLMGLAAVIVAIVAVGLGLRGKAAAVMYSPDDAIAPNGEKKERDVIVRFMTDEVMPWARTALAPIVGGADRVRCETCHGRDGRARDWRMPGVAALPKPDLRERGWEQYSGGMDAQMRNAIYGYLAEPDKQSKATYMREVVMPGMARLLHRDAYDFTRPYDYNRQRAAFGCYHCHLVR